jgi:hypothetical protein
MATKVTKTSGPTSPTKIDEFLNQLATLPPTGGKLVFGLDATASREATWDTACALTADMFEVAAVSGSLEIQLVYYRGSHGECKASGWMTDAKRLSIIMSKIGCAAGNTQIGKVLAHVRRESDKAPVAAFVFVGDAMEEKVDDLCGAAGLLRNVRAFMFQEGDDAATEKTFREIARITHGAYARFDTNVADQLRDLLKAVAAYAAGGIKALEGKPRATLLLEQLK